MDLVIRGAAALVRDWTQPPIFDGWIGIEEGRVAGTGRGIPPHAGDVVDASECIVLPGFVSAHHHLTQGVSRGVNVEGGLIPWLAVHYDAWSRMTAHDVYQAAMVSLSQLALGGATAVAAFEYLHPPGEDFVQPVVMAAEQVGLRLLYVRGCAPRLEGPLAAVLEDRGVDLTRLIEPEDDALRRTDEVLSRPTHERLRWACGPTTPVFDDGGDFHRRLQAIATSHGVSLHTHVHPLPGSLREGETAFDFVERLGLVKAGNWFAHGSRLTTDDVARLGKAQIGVVHNPSCSMLLGYPIIPLAEWDAVNDRVAVSVDGAASNDRGSMLAEAQLAWQAQRAFLSQGRPVLEPARVMTLATQGGARAMGWPELGVLDVGRPADLAVIDMRNLDFAGVPTSALRDPAAMLMRSVSGSGVRDLLVGDRFVVREGRLAGVDLAGLHSAAKSAADRLYPMAPHA